MLISTAWGLIIFALSVLPARGRDLMVVLSLFGHDCHAVVVNTSSQATAWLPMRCMKFQCWNRINRRCSKEINSPSQLRHRLTTVLGDISPGSTWSSIERLTFIIKHKVQLDAQTENQGNRMGQRHTQVLQRGFLNVYQGLPFPVQFTVKHHELHALYAFLTGPFDDALVVTMDGDSPDSESFVLWSASKTHENGPCLKIGTCRSCWLGEVYHSLRLPLQAVGFHSLFTPPNGTYQSAFEMVLAQLDSLQTARKKLPRFLASNPPTTSAEMSAVQKAIERHAVRQLMAIPGVEGALRTA